MYDMTAPWLAGYLALGQEALEKVGAFATAGGSGSRDLVNVADDLP